MKTASWIRPIDGQLVNLAFVTGIEARRAFFPDDLPGECSGAQVVAWTTENGPVNLTGVLQPDDADAVLDEIVSVMQCVPVISVQKIVSEVVQHFHTPLTDQYAKAIISGGVLGSVSGSVSEEVTCGSPSAV